MRRAGQALILAAVAVILSDYPVFLFVHSTAAALTQVGAGAVALVTGFGLFVQSHG